MTPSQCNTLTDHHNFKVNFTDRNFIITSLSISTTPSITMNSTKPLQLPPPQQQDLHTLLPRYIESLEQQLLQRLREEGLPPRLEKLQEGRSEQGQGQGLEQQEQELLGLVHRVLGQEVMGRLEQEEEGQKRAEERLVREEEGRSRGGEEEEGRGEEERTGERGEGGGEG